MIHTRSSEEDIAGLVPRAQAGDRAALEQLVRAIQDPIFSMALRMLWHPQDAHDATQEILLKLITRLNSFRGDSKFSTWTYRVAANHLLDARKSRLEAQHISFDEFAADLEDGLDLAATREDSPEAIALLEEVKVGCTLAMLSCLDRPQRLAYVLGEILDLSDIEASWVLEISEQAFRKRLSRARKTIADFMLGHCGLVNPENRCRCHRRVRRAIDTGRVNAQNLAFVPSLAHAQHFPEVLTQIRGLDRARRAAAFLRSNQSPGTDFVAMLKDLIALTP